jgi:hypothetical protein
MCETRETLRNPRYLLNKYLVTMICPSIHGNPNLGPRSNVWSENPEAWNPKPEMLETALSRCEARTQKKKPYKMAAVW